MPAMRSYDLETVDFTESLLPNANSPGGINSNFNWPIRIGLQMIAPVGDLMSTGRSVELTMKNEQFWTTITKMGGYINPEQFASEVGIGKMGVNFAAKMKEAWGAIRRRIMKDRLAYVSGDSSMISLLSTQDTGRMKTWNVTTDMGTGKNGSWSTLSTDMFWQIDIVLRYANELARVKMSNFYMGPDTEFYANQNTTLKTLIQNVVDLRGNLIGQDLRGLRLYPIYDDIYKDDSALQTQMNPQGMGSLDYSTFAAIKEKHMMRHSVAGTDYEYGLITAPKLGFTWRPPVYQQESYPDGNIVTDSWWTHSPKVFFTEIMTRYGFAVEDFAKIHRMNCLSTIMVS
jgi:hypothetical protein